MCRQGEFGAASERYYSPDIVSYEPEGEDRMAKGMEAIRAKMEWFNSTFEVLGAQVEGPWINEPYFAVKFVIDAKNRQTGEPAPMSEVAVYRVENDKVVEERFF